MPHFGGFPCTKHIKCAQVPLQQNFLCGFNLSVPTRVSIQFSVRGQLQGTCKIKISFGVQVVILLIKRSTCTFFLQFSIKKTMFGQHFSWHHHSRNICSKLWKSNLIIIPEGEKKCFHSSVHNFFSNFAAKVTLLKLYSQRF